MTAHALHIRPALRVSFAPPGGWGKWVKDRYAAFLEILHVACIPDGWEQWIAREIARRNLR